MWNEDLILEDGKSQRVRETDPRLNINPLQPPEMKQHANHSITILCPKIPLIHRRFLLAPVFSIQTIHVNITQGSWIMRSSVRSETLPCIFYNNTGCSWVALFWTCLTISLISEMNCVHLDKDRIQTDTQGESNMPWGHLIMQPRCWTGPFDLYLHALTLRCHGQTYWNVQSMSRAFSPHLLVSILGNRQ